MLDSAVSKVYTGFFKSNTVEDIGNLVDKLGLGKSVTDSRLSPATDHSIVFMLFINNPDLLEITVQTIDLEGDSSVHYVYKDNGKVYPRVGTKVTLVLKSGVAQEGVLKSMFLKDMAIDVVSIEKDGQTVDYFSKDIQSLKH